MIRYLDAKQVADRLGVSRRTAMSMMLEMNPIAISGKTRIRYRVTEENMDRWMAKRMIGKQKTVSFNTGKRLARR